MLHCRQRLGRPGALELPLFLLLTLLVGACQSRRENPLAQRATRQAQLRLDSLRVDSVARNGGQLPGAILPAQRIVAFYGSATHKTMGVLGQYPKAEMLRRLDRQVQAWRRADPAQPARPALHMVAVIAQRDAGPDGKYRELQPDSVIRRVIRWGHAHGCLVFLDVQVGLSTLPAELPRLAPYLRDSIVHLGIDPEFSMKNGRRPGTEVGEFDARDVNYARQFLARLVSENRLPPKVLVVHRFRQDMLTNYQDISLDPRVQIVMHMDGWGTPGIKRSSYRKFIRAEPVQYAGFKIFFKQDRKMDNSRLMTPQEVAALRPDPLYIQYQ
ncbi:hypothetical protein LJ737_01340 [Hymenobacter sp. 15J16-1T3B]|uniref:hypothetical protein n=1 Tax=Hymenobacter sp. 15J16-1T3B TaxID=2886941 RepID=UPI001D115082|nr:hypothetical protein [Hymenobacter sp. 15J16-1T3B]MCC3155862.1 hypothetical protein [Hymenobacter sp. 15J16-1T3B]